MLVTSKYRLATLATKSNVYSVVGSAHNRIRVHAFSTSFWRRTITATPHSDPTKSEAPPPATKQGEQLERFQSLAEANTTNVNRDNDLAKPDRHDLSPAAWAHPGFNFIDMNNVAVAHHEPKNFADKIARNALLTVRWCFDKATGYKHPPPGHEDDPKYIVTDKQWLQRIVFLESIAGVPGMVGGMVRHLQSLRLLRRDRAWIETLLEEAYNERMHLLTFMQLTNPGIFMRGMLLIAQGVFFNSFFIAYLVNPRICHRFVGYLEEEAVVTYTRCINDIEKGLIPSWDNAPVPDIAKKYWKMADNATIKDLLYYVRADECKHREVNHTLGNLKQNVDRNPYAFVVDCGREQPAKDLKSNISHPVGWDRDEIAA
ncbi:hypothetical protein AWJ20_2578 [Sugiyamaella lignohabitans]|uniref:Alternative oxidase n=1 Tax=Sugiyamaella lignohabitans TaxID=796027 RepID=A0A167F8J7_9ASCO|nr:uncharacterized protein AWJ20_2578 [Sugiyamaella lignohabitans]ANB14959.1 hypothetical protein AWJ20_2578 [Sugiyamaella lignohabitans]